MHKSNNAKPTDGEEVWRYNTLKNIENKYNCNKTI